MLKKSPTWTAENHSKAMEMWKTGASQSQIANALGMTVCSVAGRMSRNRNDFPRRIDTDPTSKKRIVLKRTNSVWTDERLATAARLWKAGWTEAECAEALDTSPTAFNQMKKRYRPLFACERSKLVRDRKPAKPKRVAPNNLDELFEQSESNSAYDGRRFILSGQEPVRFASLKAKECKFPVNAPDEPCNADMLCCGAEARYGSWCSAHAAVSYRRPA